MSGLFCPNYGKQHNTSERYCSFCGEDLSEAILKYKDKRLPVNLNSTAPGSKADPQEESVKYPTGSLLPEATRAGQDSPIRRKRAFSIWGFLFNWCC